MPPKGKPSSSHSSRPSSSRPSSSSRSSHSSSSHSSRSSRPSSPPRHSSPPPRHNSYHGPSHHHHTPPPPPPPHHGGYAGPPPPPPHHHHTHHTHTTYHYDGTPRRRASSGGCVSIIAFILLIIFVFAAAKFVRAKNDSREENRGAGWHDSAEPQQESHQDLFVPALNRDVPWSEEYDSYYDKQSDCYFFLNTDLDPAIWQYWFEGISSQYGDYGWLEWDAKEKQWYVQIGETKWEKLPDNLASDLWHFD